MLVISDLITSVLLFGQFNFARSRAVFVLASGYLFKHSIASLQAIHAMGVTIDIDDFGTGFSSLSYVAKLPVDTLKIDRSFVIDKTAEPKGLALVSTIISLAHSLKLKVVAEGVETEVFPHSIFSRGFRQA